MIGYLFWGVAYTFYAVAQPEVAVVVGLISGLIVGVML